MTQKKRVEKHSIIVDMCVAWMANVNIFILKLSAFVSRTSIFSHLLLPRCHLLLVIILLLSMLIVVIAAAITIMKKEELRKY